MFKFGHFLFLGVFKNPFKSLLEANCAAYVQKNKEFGSKN